MEKREKVTETIEEKETNKEFGTRHRTFGVGPRSRGLALGDFLMHREDGTLLQ